MSLLFTDMSKVNLEINFPEISTLEIANLLVNSLTKIEQAYLYKALYLNNMRIDTCESIIKNDKYST